MADREKLIDVLEIGLDKIDRGSLPWAVEMLADHLIANGVYISKPCDAAPSEDWKFTNADRIRAMSDGELAKWLVSKTFYRESAWSEPTYLNFLTGRDDTESRAVDGTLEWLQQPAEED